MDEAERKAYRGRRNVTAANGPHRQRDGFTFYGVSGRGHQRFWALYTSDCKIRLFSRPMTDKEKRWWDEAIEPVALNRSSKTHTDLPPGPIRKVLMGLLSDAQRAELVARIVRKES